MMAAAADDWVTSAMTDGGVVAELLLRLKKAKTTPAVLANPAVSALRWGIRQPRSRSPRCDGVSQRKEADSAKNSRCSPSTPLSWSGGCGGSGGGGSSSSPSTNADGCEATSRQTSGSSAVGSRSKVLMTDDSTSAGARKLRRKKTFAELKEEENNLLKERICLEKEIASLRASFNERGAENESLKRMKMDLNFHGREPYAVVDTDKENSGQPCPRESLCLHQNSQQQPRHVPAGDDKKPDCCKTEKMDSAFLLPDLNVMPSEDDSSSTLYGIS